MRVKTDGLARPVDGEIGRLSMGALTTSDVVTASLANVAPAMSFMFSFAVIEGGAGVASGITIALVAVAIALHANSISQMSKKLPSSGSYITYIGKTFGPVAGTASAVLVAFGYIVSTAGLMAVVGGWTDVILRRFFHFEIPWQLLTVLFVAGFGLLMLKGVKISTRWLVMGFFFELGAILVITGLAIVKYHAFISTPSHALAPFNPADLKGGIAGIGLGFPIAIWMFTGVGNSMGLAEDTANPRKVIPRSIFIALGFASVIYLLLTWVTTIGFHDSSLAITRSSIPLVSLGVTVLGPFAVLVFLAGFTSTYAEIIGATNGQARMIFSAGRDGLLPPVLGRVNAARAPSVALIVYLGAGLAITLVWGSFVNPITLFGYLGSLAGIPIATLYLVVNIVVPVFYWRHYRGEMKVGRHIVLPVLGALVMLLPVWGLLQPGQPAPFSSFPYVGAAAIVVGLLYGVWVRAKRPYVRERVGHILADDPV